MQNLSFEMVSYPEATEAIHRIRSQVFQVEQGVDPEIDFDGQDAGATHILVCRAGEPIATARIRLLSDRLAKIERVAVLAVYRGQGIGKQIMERAIVWLAENRIPEVKINAQVQAKLFYEKMGFIQYGEAFDEAGIAHIEMRKLVK